MKILKLLNKKNILFFLTYLVFLSSVLAEDKPIDIWNIEKKGNESIVETDITNKKIPTNLIGNLPYFLF